MSKNTKYLITGTNALELLTILFIGLKLLNKISWPWVWVLSPIWISLIIGIIIILGIIIYNFITTKKRIKNKNRKGNQNEIE
jgi:hypothetical protein